MYKIQGTHRTVKQDEQTNFETGDGRRTSMSESTLSSPAPNTEAYLCPIPWIGRRLRSPTERVGLGFIYAMATALCSNENTSLVAA